MIRMGVIGTGNYGSLHLSALKDREVNSGDIKLCGFAEIDEGTRKIKEEEFKCHGYADYHDMIEREKLDAVTIATPDHLHYDITMECLNYNIPLLVEKPFSTKTSEAEAMIKKAEEANIFLQVDFHKRYDPYHIDLKMRIEDKEAGNLQYGYLWIEDVLDVGTDMIGKKAWGTGSSPVWFLGIHAIDLSLWLMNFPKPVEVHAKGFKGKLTSLGLDIYDSIKSTVSYDNGVTITYDTSVILPNSYEARVHQGVKLVGTEGILELNTQYRGGRYCTPADGMITPNIGGRYRFYNKNGGISYRGYLYEAIHDFVDNIHLIKNGRTISEMEGRYPSPAEAILSTKIGEAIHQSVTENRVIPL
ncbi:MAG TPA: Gfo/Idh/MocA family oxidoreductase [Spirochaetia bacterium]|nr:Gfo/Idh/MocA family oxidoreductase [Spirochaetia bacterium]